MISRRAETFGLIVTMLTGLGMAACGSGSTPEVDGYGIAGAREYPLFDHTLTWTGDELLVIGGAGGDPTDGRLVDDPLSWNPVDGVEAIASPPGPPRNRHTSVWTGDELIVWSGTTEPFGVGDGLLFSTLAYDPATDRWRELADSPAPVARVRGRGAHFGRSIIVTGGSTPAVNDEGTVGLYDLDHDTWTVTGVPGDALTVVATGNAAYVLWVDRERAIRLSHLDPETVALTDVELPQLPTGADRANAVVADGRLILWVEASPSEPGQTDDTVAALVLDDDTTLAAGPTARANWRELAVEVEFPGSATGFSEVRPLVHTDDWVAFMEGAELKWIRIDDGLEIRRALTTPQSCALNTEAVGTPDFIVAWGGNCSRIDDDGTEQQIVEHFVFEPPIVDSED